MDYASLIRDSFRITLRNRYLWLFGFFAGGTGGCSVPGGGGGGFDNGDDPAPPDFPEFSGALSLQSVPDLPATIALIVAVAVLALLVVIIFMILSLISQGGLANSVAAIERGEQRGFGSTWRAGTSRFWRVLGYYIIFFLISLAVLIVVLLPALLAFLGVFLVTESLGARIAAGVLAIFAAIGLLVLLFIPLGIVSQYALREVAVRGNGILDSVGSGYRLFRRNLGRSLLVWVIQLGLMLALGLGLVIALLIVGLVLFLPTIGLGIAELRVAAIVAGVAAGLILLPVFLIAVAALNTFNHTYWTLAYLRLETAETPPAPAYPLPPSGPGL